MSEITTAVLIVTKTVEWSYPTSENAKRFGFKGGCWTVSLNERSEEGTTITVRALKGFLTRYNALDYARTLPEPWSIHFSKVYPQDMPAGWAKGAIQNEYTNRRQ